MIQTVKMFLFSFLSVITRESVCSVCISSLRTQSMFFSHASLCGNSEQLSRDLFSFRGTQTQHNINQRSLDVITQLSLFTE